jgi:hypothetical protein
VMGASSGKNSISMIPPFSSKISPLTVIGFTPR